MLQGINSQADMYSVYNRIQNNSYGQNSIVVEKPLQDPGNTKASQEAVSVAAPIELDLRLDDIRPRQKASIEDISLDLNENAGSFEMKGRDSDINSLDMEKALSDMQKDQALMQYQYFVGSAGSYSSTEDGTVIVK